MIMLTPDTGSEQPQKPRSGVVHRNWVAIAAMSQNRVIGASGSIPWHLPENFKWFKRVTTGHIVVMGRKTFEAVGLLGGRGTIVLSKTKSPNEAVKSIEDLEWISEREDRTLFICGGSQIYQQLLPICSNLLLTTINKEIEGDTYFPEFDHLFKPLYNVTDTALFKIDHYIRR